MHPIMNIPIINIQHQLNERLTLIRDNWKLLRNPEKIQIPTRVRSWIIDYVNETKQNKTKQTEMIGYMKRISNIIPH